MKKIKFILVFLIVILSVNLVFASSCKDTDAKEKAGIYPRGVNYYQNGLNSGENKFGSWSRKDFCKGNQIYEFYCYYSNGQYYNGTAVYKCPKGCNTEIGACNPGTYSIVGKITDSSTTGSFIGIYFGIGIVIIILVLIWFLLRKKRGKNKRKSRK
jgi:hypothetical protein